MPTVKNIVKVLENIAPCKLAESWDNVGLLVGDKSQHAGKIMLCIDLTERVLEEAIDKKINLIMAYHPVIFKPLKKIDSNSIVYQAIKNDIAIYSMHTAFDIVKGGANDILAELLTINNPQSLTNSDANTDLKIVTFAECDNANSVLEAAFRAGAGVIDDYFDCGFVTHGVGIWCGNEDTNPTVGNPGVHQAAEESRLEFRCPPEKLRTVISEIKQAHTYEEPAIEVFKMEAIDTKVGLGRIGNLANELSLVELISHVKQALGIDNLLVAESFDTPVKYSKIAVSAGACGSMWSDALSKGADAYITGEMRHHDALTAQRAGLTVILTGHSNSERPTLKTLASQIEAEEIRCKVLISQVDKDPLEFR